MYVQKVDSYLFKIQKHFVAGTFKLYTYDYSNLK